jgi:cell division protein FtsI (penicillin-binding protein 3)
MPPVRTEKYLRLRIWLLAVSFCGLLLVVAARAVQVQMLWGPELAARAKGQYETLVTTTARRGTIRDARGNPLAVSLELTSVAAHPRQIDNPVEVARRLAPMLKLSPEILTRRIAADRSFVWVKRQADPDAVRDVEALGLEGISFHHEYRRFYPNKTLAAQVLGFCNIDGKGIEGLEHYYDRHLNADAASRKALRDALGRHFAADDQAARLPVGNDVILTIDTTIQHLAETALEQAVTAYDARSGLALVMEPATGAILAMAHYPFFNPNNYSRATPQLWRNRIVADSFEPGSTMKIFTAAAALDRGGYAPQSIFFCENGAYRIGRHTIHDTKPHGWLTLQDVVMCSSNIGAVKIGQGLGQQVLHQTLADFNFGHPLGIDFPGETAGRLSRHERWTRVDAGAIAFGQGVSVSALQLAAATAAIANDGILMQPYLVKEIRDPAGRLVQGAVPRPLRRVVSSRCAGQLRSILGTVVHEGGTGTHAALSGYTAGGKTGTAQKVEPSGGYAKNRYIGSFVGFAPLENPRLVVLVSLDEPRRAHYGGVVAAPAFREIAQKSLDYLNVPPAASPAGDVILARQSEVTG